MSTCWISEPSEESSETAYSNKQCPLLNLSSDDQRPPPEHPISWNRTEPARRSLSSPPPGCPPGGGLLNGGRGALGCRVRTNPYIGPPWGGNCRLTRSPWSPFGGTGCVRIAGLARWGRGWMGICPGLSGQGVAGPIRTNSVHLPFLAKKEGPRRRREPLLSLESGRQDSNLRPSAPKASQGVSP